jgi:hypothetical protein
MPLHTKLELVKRTVASQCLQDGPREQASARDLPPPKNLQRLEILSKPRKADAAVDVPPPKQESKTKLDAQAIERLSKPRHQSQKWKEPPMVEYQRVDPTPDNPALYKRLGELPSYRKKYAVKFDGRDPLMM